MNSTFIETQFPVAKLSAEAYKERKAGASQTLTGLGKWWGRKPLVLVRAIILGLLLPATDDPHKDMDIFLKLMTMDEEGLWQRKDKAIPQATLIKELKHQPPSVQKRYLQGDGLRQLAKAERETLQRLVFEQLPYSEKLAYCRRPEQIAGPSPEAWAEINAHLGTTAQSLPELVQALGERRFGRRPRVGDAFCGGGSVPFEAARLGCDAYGSDLNPVAALLTWAALNIVGGGEEVARQVQAAQEEVFRAVDAQITAWGIEHDAQGWRADAFLYCTEAVCPECGWKVPLAPAWVIAEKTNVVAELMPDVVNRRFTIEIHEGASAARMKQAKENGTIKDSRLHCPHCDISTPMEVVRRNLRLWENDDLVPRPDDIFQERLYCIRWVETYDDEQGRERIRRHYRAPISEDLAREAQVLDLLQERFHEWQMKGCIPSRTIESGYNTDQPIRERGWTHWHHLFTPRDLLVQGLFLNEVAKVENARSRVAVVLVHAKLINNSARTTIWNSIAGHEGIMPTSTSQALNTLWNWGCRGYMMYQSLRLSISSASVNVGSPYAFPQDASSVNIERDYWVTDPPYADAVNYHELSEYFLAWHEKLVLYTFPDWYADSKRALAIRGSDPVAFRGSMVSAYRNLNGHTSDDGMQVVMFTHQDASVWADLTMILWAAGLRVTAAWTIATETDAAIKKGNYVQGTVLLVCRKRVANEALFLDELVPRIEQEVRRQLDTMVSLDDASDPNFGDADYQLAAYAAALRVLTAQPIEDIDPAREVNRLRAPGEENPIERLIRSAVKIACDHLTPRGLDTHFWKTLTPMERFYLKGLEVESHGEYRNGVYQELARGFGALAYTDLLADTTANQTRLKTPKEFGRRQLGGEGFGGTLLRHILFAVYQAEGAEEPRRGLNYLKTELPDYWAVREKLLHLLRYLAELRRVSGMEHWHASAESAEILTALVRGDHV